MTMSLPQIEILIVFYNRFDTVEALAEQIAVGATEIDGVRTSMLPVEDQPIE